MKSCQKYFSTCLLGIAALLVGSSPAWAQIAPSLGTASSFGALGGAGVTCTNPIPALPATTVTGDVGSLLAAVSSVTGFPPTGSLCSLSGAVELGATAAHANLVTAYNTIDTANPCPTDAPHNLSGDLGGKTLAPGVYCISGVGLLTGTLTLAGPANGVWIFKGASSITPIGGATPALRSKVVMANGGQACNVYWRTVSEATFVNTDFVGNLLAGSKIAFDGSSLAGRALANTESVTMTGSSITACDGGGTQPPPPPSCDKDHKHHKHAKHHKHHKHASHHNHDKQQCDGDHDDGDHGDDDGDHGDDDGDHGDDHGDHGDDDGDHGDDHGDRGGDHDRK